MYKDITGLRFGKLVAVNPVEKRDNRNELYWLCKCDCGNEVVVRGYSLRSGNTKSCGCYSKEAWKKIGIANRKHFGCINCDSTEHYAKGYCRSCYDKLRRGTLK